MAVDTTDDVNVMSSYPACDTRDESGPEEVYALTLPGEGVYDVVATIDAEIPADLDVYILNAPCDSDNCLASGSTRASVAGLAGGTTLFISVDGFNGSSGVGTLSVSCTDVLIFEDGFESGNTTAWSATVP
jgi:hypothetical protein